MSEGHEIPCSWALDFEFVDVDGPKSITRDYADNTLDLFVEYKASLESISDNAMSAGTSILNDMVFSPLVAPSISMPQFSHIISTFNFSVDALDSFDKLEVDNYNLGTSSYIPFISINVARPVMSNVNLYDFNFALDSMDISEPNIITFNFDIASPSAPELSSQTFAVISPQFLTFSALQFIIPALYDIEEINADIDLSNRFITDLPSLENVTIYNHGLSAVIGVLQSFVEGNLVISVYAPIDLKSKYMDLVNMQYNFLNKLWGNRPVAKINNKTIVVHDTFVTKYVDLFDDKTTADLVLQIKYKVKEMLLDGWASVVKFIGENILEFVRLVYQREVLLVEGRAKLFDQFKSILSLYVAQARLELLKYIGVLAKESVQRYQFLADVEVETAFAKYNKSIAALYAANEQLKTVKVDEAKLYALQANALASIYKAKVQQQLTQLSVYKALVSEYKAKASEYTAKLSDHVLHVKQNVLQNELISSANQITAIQAEANVIPALVDSLVTKRNMSNVIYQAERLKYDIERSMLEYTTTNLRNYVVTANYMVTLLNKQKDYLIKVLQYNATNQHFNLYNTYYNSIVQLASVISDTYMQTSNTFVSTQQQYYDIYQKYANGSADVYATILSGKLSKYRIGATLNTRGDITYSLDKAHGTRDTISYSNNRSNECIMQFESM